MKTIRLQILGTLFLLLSSCTGSNLKYESKYQAAFEYINDCRNLRFWKNNICDSANSGLFPINIIPFIYPDGGDASGFKPLIDYIFNANENSNIYVLFSEQDHNSIRAYCIVNTHPFFNPNDFLLDSSSVPIHDFSFTFIFNEDNTIQTVWHEMPSE